MSDASPVVHLDGVVKNYGEEVVTRVLHGIDLTLERGEFAALVGPSGSGKSTLLNILGLLDRPTTGRVFIQGRDTAGLDDAELTALRGRSIGFVFQFHHLISAFTAVENVAMPLCVDAGRVRPGMLEQARAMLAGIGLADRAEAHTNKLSGGQQQRVAIARALITEPALVLADEPTGNLDTHTADDAFELLRRFNRELRTAFLIVTHDHRLADRCDRIITLVDGRIESDTRESSGAEALSGAGAE
jgi:lipoprotein-releasing system ATP-binding protein